MTVGNFFACIYVIGEVTFYLIPVLDIYIIIKIFFASTSNIGSTSIPFRVYYSLTTIELYPISYNK